MPYPNPAPRGVAWLNTAVLAWMRQRIVAAGGDPASIPDEPPRFMRSKEVMARTGITSLTTLWRRQHDSGFPKPVTLRQIETEDASVS